MSDEQLFSCPTCQTNGFTARGLKSHRCKGINRNPETPKSRNPEAPTKDGNFEVVDADSWQHVRESIAEVRRIGRRYLFGQCWIGWQLAALKQRQGVHRGRPSKNSADSAEFRPWAEIVEAETGLNRRSADVFINLFHAVEAKMKRKLGTKKAKPYLALFESTDPLSVPEDQREELQEVIASLVEGETQGSLMRELGVLPEPKKPPQNPGGDRRPDDEPTMGQLAFHFFEPLGRSLFDLRRDPHFKEYLGCLREHPTDDEPVALSTIEQDARALLDEIRSIRAAQGKQRKAS